MSSETPTFIGEIQSVTGALVRVRLRDDLEASLLLLKGRSYRVGQIGAFVRIPLGYVQLYGLCTEVGATAAPPNLNENFDGQARWLAVSLFGEAIGSSFERGVSQYPTIGDEVHLVLPGDLETIYGSLRGDGKLNVGHVSASTSVPAGLNLNKLVSRHSAVVGSTGSGKSNFIGVLLGLLTESRFPSARVLVIDPHGEYAAASRNHGSVFRVSLTAEDGESLVVPYWALPFDQLLDLGFGQMQPTAESAVRDLLTEKKRSALTFLKNPPDPENVTADTPIPFCIRNFWFELDDYERRTLESRSPEVPAALIERGNPLELKSNIYPSPGQGSSRPFKASVRGISRQLEFLKNRISDSRFKFLFSPGERFTPDAEGKVKHDLDDLARAWVGNDHPITVLDVSGIPSEVRSAIVGTMLQILYDFLFWSGDLPVSGRKQPLLVILEEAHQYLPCGLQSGAHRIVTRIAKEGRKYGIGISVVTQRPSELDQTVLSQCGTFVAFRMSNNSDRGVIKSSMPDELANLSSILPALRTGEALIVGEAVPIPTRIRVREAERKPTSTDPNVCDCWKKTTRPNPDHYATSLARWRSQSMES